MYHKNSLKMTPRNADKAGLRKRLDQVRKYAGLRQDQFLKIFNLTPESYNQLFISNSEFPEDYLYFIYENYHISLRWLIKGEGSMRSFKTNSRLRAFAGGAVSTNKVLHPNKEQYSYYSHQNTLQQRSFLPRVEKQIVLLEEALYMLRKTLLNKAGIDTFDDHGYLIAKARKLKQRLINADADSDYELPRLIEELEFSVHQNRKYLHDQIEYFIQDADKPKIDQANQIYLRSS